MYTEPKFRLNACMAHYPDFHKAWITKWMAIRYLLECVYFFVPKQYLQTEQVIWCYTNVRSYKGLKLILPISYLPLIYIAIYDHLVRQMDALPGSFWYILPIFVTPVIAQTVGEAL